MIKMAKEWDITRIETEVVAYADKLFDDKYDFSDIIYKDYDTTSKKLKLLLTELDRLREEELARLRENLGIKEEN